ncbi:MAG: hypothetical protein HQM03_16820 [Magnetococcales bacterium]|nr:hypothetical protein [Magnetococcales bacterium]
MTKHSKIMVTVGTFLLLAGCAMDRATEAQPKAAPPKKPVATAPADEASARRFIGANRKELTAKYGPPNMTMDVTVAGKPPAEGYLYYPKDGKGCIHAFVMDEKTGNIFDYFCR